MPFIKYAENKHTNGLFSYLRNSKVYDLMDNIEIKNSSFLFDTINRNWTYPFGVDNEKFNKAENYIEDFNELCKIDSIKEIMKCGFMADRMNKFGKPVCGRIPKSSIAIESVQKTLNYIKWDEDVPKWENVGGKYVETGKIKRFVTGTHKEVEVAIHEFGNPLEHNSENMDFPVWCNGEVIVMFLKDGYLTYATR